MSGSSVNTERVVTQKWSRFYGAWRSLEDKEVIRKYINRFQPVDRCLIDESFSGTCATRSYYESI
jgi:hypothetical protein